VRSEGLLLMSATAKRVNCPQKREIATWSGPGFKRVDGDLLDGLPVNFFVDKVLLCMPAPKRIPLTGTTLPASFAYNLPSALCFDTNTMLSQKL
jgi:hypothetical protein